MLFTNAIVAIALSVSVNAMPQPYPNKCGDQVCPADKAKCCEVIINGVAELGCFAECPPIQALQRRQPYPNKCGDQVCPADKSKCCEVIVNGVAEIGCFAECPAPPSGEVNFGRRDEPVATIAASPPVATFGPKCGDSFFCPVGKVCCPDALYECADPDKISEQCPKQ
ncbi:hypothetical protein FAUST_10804 [Fusarium austroamericanum]|uniref:Uncharacterized protein n=1 Tax=Fusarium austroamericanum TaxID=282268 RepID=A0AAN5Z036_FUSAU|nr:hypothetical protein FAUST_10804 [Fusarium austroamericanum]